MGPRQERTQLMIIKKEQWKNYHSLYINFRFEDLLYDNTYFCGKFISLESDEYQCEFLYNRNTGTYDIWNNKGSVEQILPLPTGHLEFLLERNGKLKNVETKISC